MKHMCITCRRIHRQAITAHQCCARIMLIPDEQVVPCETDGEYCLNRDCPFCQGTGLMLKSAEKARTSGH